MARILAFSGSSRRDSTNQKTLDVMTAALAASGASINAISLRDYAMPIYDGDLEASDGLPATASAFRDLLAENDALVIACPEYNGFMTPLLLNTIDWATRSAEAAPDLSGFRDKPVLLVSSAPGGLAGMRATTHLRTMLSGIGCLVFPDHFSVPAGFKAFGEDGTLLDENLTKRAGQIATRFNDYVSKLS